MDNKTAYIRRYSHQQDFPIPRTLKDMREKSFLFSKCTPSKGLPYAVHGIFGLNIVLTTSRNGTSVKAALNKSGRMVMTAPISNPPALLP